MSAINTPHREKLVKFDGHNLLLKVDGKVQMLGGIRTRKGQLTKTQKLKAVQYTGEWVEI